MARSMKTMDGNTAAAHVSYAFTDVAAIYPITPSSPMADYTDQWATQGRKNIFGHEVIMSEMQSEGGAAGAVHGSLQAGALTTTYTASQGLLLMLPNMYKIAGELLPAVFHVSARALASHALSIFGDHSDVYACRQSGFAMLCSNSVQEVMDLGAVAHLSTIESRVPFLHFFDGFRTSHEIQKIETWDYDDLKDMCNMDAVAAFRNKSLNPNRPQQRGTAQNPDIFFQAREASNRFYDVVPEVVQNYMDKVNAKIGTNYKLFNYYGAEDADKVIIAMGSVCETIDETIDYMNANGHKVGVVKVRLYRPFSAKHLIAAIPETVKHIIVLDRTKEPGSLGEPLYLDVVASLRGTKFESCLVTTGRYGLGSKDTTPAQIIAAYKNTEKPRFTIGIKDDVTNLSLEIIENPSTAPEGTTSCKFWGLGADGTVGANKNSVKIIGDHTDKKVQAYFQYDSKKSGGVTISHLRFGDKPIKSTYYVKQANFVACHNEAYVNLYKMVEDVKPGGNFLLNCTWSDAELDTHLPASMKQYIAKNNINLYTCDAVSIAKEIGLGARRTNSVLQAAFFKIANIIPIEEAANYMKDAIRKTYGKKGENIVNMNIAAVDAGIERVHKVDVPASWATCEADVAPVPFVGRDQLQTDYLNKVLSPYAHMDGDSIPVSTFLDTPTGLVPNGTAAFEKRGIATDIPVWNKDNCIQCNQCAYVCPHGVIRPFVIEGEAELAGTNGDYAEFKGGKDENKKYTMGISALDCTGCGSCAQTCPAPNKALVMNAVNDEIVSVSQEKYNHLFNNVTPKEVPFKENTVKGVEFKQPLLEFSGACPGCGETPYAKLITQLFGDRMFIANATGCSSIWGNSLPSTPYTVNAEGRGPAWANSLFEDNAEFGFGMAISMKARRNELKTVATRLAAELGDVATAWVDAMEDAEGAETTGKALLAACEKIAANNEDAQYVVDNKEMLIKPSMWIFGGDGWAYDIGYGGVDHVLASGENINIMVFDTEVYSNTGGQASKSTPLGAVAKFAASGKAVKKKDMVQIAMAYGYIYVAQIAMGASQKQTLDAIREAEAYDGPSLIIAYAPCINQGLKNGMNKAQDEMKRAVNSGYWNLIRFNPDLAKEGKNPLMIDSKPATESYRDFIMSEVRYDSLTKRFPERAEQLFEDAEKLAKERYEHFQALKESYEPEK